MSLSSLRLELEKFSCTDCSVLLFYFGYHWYIRDSSIVACDMKHSLVWYTNMITAISGPSLVISFHNLLFVLLLFFDQ